MIRMRCPGCDTRFEFERGLEGKKIKCRSCGDVFRVESPKPAPKTSRSRRPSEDDEEPPRSGRSRRPVDDEDDDRPSRSRRPMHDEDDDRPSRRRAEPAKRKVHPALLIAPLGVFALIGVVVLVVVLGRGKKKATVAEEKDVAQVPTAKCPLDLPERDLGTLVLPDSGNFFGYIRKEGVGRDYVFEPYDLALGKRVGRLSMPDMDEPRYASLSPDGKRLLVMEGSGNPTLSVWSIPENRALTRKWNIYPNSGLFKAEFLGNDRIATLSTGRFFDVWPLPALNPPVVTDVSFPGGRTPLGTDRGGFRNLDRYQREAAFSADKKRLAVWNGDGYTIVDTADGSELHRTLPFAQLDSKPWEDAGRFDVPKGSGVAFSPDGKLLAGVVLGGRGAREPVLFLWDTAGVKPPIVYPLPSNQFNNAPGLYWWGNKFVVTHGGEVQQAMIGGMMIDIASGVGKRQVMGPASNKYGYGRDGRLWYAGSEERTSPATMHVVDRIDVDALTEPDDYDTVPGLGEQYFLRRLWLEPAGVLRKPTRIDPPLGKGLIHRP